MPPSAVCFPRCLHPTCRHIAPFCCCWVWPGWCRPPLLCPLNKEAFGTLPWTVWRMAAWWVWWGMRKRVQAVRRCPLKKCPRVPSAATASSGSSSALTSVSERACEENKASGWELLWGSDRKINYLTDRTWTKGLKPQSLRKWSPPSHFVMLSKSSHPLWGKCWCILTGKGIFLRDFVFLTLHVYTVLSREKGKKQRKEKMWDRRRKEKQKHTKNGGSNKTNI